MNQERRDDNDMKGRRHQPKNEGLGQRGLLLRRAFSAVHEGVTSAFHRTAGRRLRLLGATILGLTVLAAKAVPADSPAEGLKAFLLRPPILREIRCILEVWDPEGDPALSATNYLLLRYQSNALLYAESDAPFTVDPEDWFASADIIVGRFDETYWLKEFGTIGVWTNRFDPEEVGNRVEYAYRDVLKVGARRVLQLGCTVADLRTAQWLGDTWLATNSDLGTWASGQILVDRTGRPTAMRVEQRRMGRPRTEPPEKQWLYDYSYTYTLGVEHLPSEVTVIPIGGFSTTPYARLRYLHMDASKAPLPPQYFALTDALLQRARHRYVISNRFRIYHTPRGDQVIPDDRARPAAASTVWVRAFAVLLVCSITVIGPLILRRAYRKRGPRPSLSSQR